MANESTRKYWQRLIRDLNGKDRSKSRTKPQRKRKKNHKKNKN